MSMRTFAIPAGVEDEKRSEQAIRDFVRQWVGLLADAGFKSINILLRDGEKVVLASVKP